MGSNETRIDRRQFLTMGGAAITGVMGTRTTTALSIGVQDGSMGPRQPIRVLSYNIRHGMGTDGVYDLRRVAAVIRAVDPDVVALQEVDKGYHVPWRDTSRSDFDNQPALLSKWTGMNAAYFVHIDYTGTENFEEYGEAHGQYGDLILSKHPILRTEAHPFRVTGEDNAYLQNKIAAARINVRGAQFWFYSVHANAFDIEINAAQQEQLIQTTRRKSLPQVVAGDFNARYGIGTNQRQKTYKRLNDAFVDVLWRTGDVEYTVPALGKDGLKRRLDYVFTTDEVGIAAGNVVSTGEGPSPSDHRPITADLVLSSGRTGSHDSDV